MMDAVHEPGVWRIVFMTGSGVGKTSVLDNIQGYFIHQDPSPILSVLPTIDEAQGHSRERLTPFFQATPVLARLVGEARSRDSGDTLRFKKFPGGYLALAGANSAASLQRRHVRIVIGDEIDSYPASADNIGDPVSLAIQRTVRFWNRLVVLGGTPTIRGISRLDKIWDESDQRRFFVPCANCGVHFVMVWEKPRWREAPGGEGIPCARVVFEDNNPETTRLKCESCNVLLSDAARLDAVRAGAWRPTAPLRDTAGFHIWEAYATPRLADVVTEFFEKRKSAEMLKTFINAKLGELWEQDEDKAEKFEWRSIRARAEDDSAASYYKLGDVPAGVLVVFGGVDTQNDRLAPIVCGFGRGEECWLLYWGEIHGDPVYDETREQLDALLQKTFTHPSGTELSIVGTAIDSGGGRTQAIYNYARTRAPKVIAIKGQNQPGLPIIAGKPSLQDVSYGGKLIPQGVQLWPVGSDTAKGEIYARLKIDRPGPRAIHFPAGLPDEFYEQLTAEKLITKYKKGVPYQEWFLPSGKRNEVLDGMAYCFAAAIRGGIQRVNWDQVERSIKGAPGEVQAQQAPLVVRSRWLGRA